MSLHWTHNKPNKKGFYMINYGDIGNDDNMEPIKVDEHPTDGFYIVDMKGDVNLVRDLSDSIKYAYLNDALKDAPVTR